MTVIDRVPLLKKILTWYKRDPKWTPDADQIGIKAMVVFAPDMIAVQNLLGEIYIYFEPVKHWTQIPVISHSIGSPTQQSLRLHCAQTFRTVGECSDFIRDFPEAFEFAKRHFPDTTNWCNENQSVVMIPAQ